MVFLLFPGIWHAFAPRAEIGWTEHFVGFRGAYPETLQKKGFLDPAMPVYRPGRDLPLLENYYAIFELADAERPGFQLRIGALIIQMIAGLLSGDMATSLSSEAESLVNQAKFLMQEYIYGMLTSRDFERHLSVSYSSFSSVFHDYTGMSPHQYFLQLKVNQAKLLLTNEGSSVKEVAFALNFESEFYFSRLFKKKTGFSPLQWKRSQTGEASQPDA